MQRYAKVMPVIAMPHMGVEYRSTAEGEKISAYHAMIDHGADAVIGAHPHVIQNSESYHGKLIAYSLGNFLFDQHNVSRATNIGLGVGIKLTIADGAAASLYEQVAPSCKVFQDDCLARLSAKLTARPVIAVSYSFTCYDESNAVGGVPKLGTAAVCDQAKRTATVDGLTSLARQW
jgi:poly-gamma-glutamate synthesis protein (capsule biosynthesis protein)